MSYGGKPGDMAMVSSLEVDGKKTRLDARDGTFDISKFDATGITGTFAFEATAEGKNVKIAGKFDYVCAGDSKCK